MEINMDPLQKQMLDDTFDAFTMLSGGSLVSLMHVKGGYTRYNKDAVDLFGLPGEYIKNGAVNWNDYLHPEDRKRYMDVMGPLVTGESMTYDITYRVRTVNEEYVVFRAVGAVLRGEDGMPNLIGGVLINQGLTENTDPVTVLPNKNAYFEELKKKLEAGSKVLSLQVGISRFSNVNEVYGYTYGNRILQEVAWQIQETVKERAMVFRTDGATFTILSDILTRDEIAAIYDHIRYVLQRGIEVNGIKNTLAANGGLISSFGTSEDVGTIYSCLNYAYEESKIRKHGDLVDFNGSINYDGFESIELINEIRESAANGCENFHLLHIPVIDAKTEKLNGTEAVIYFENEKFGRVDEENFMPILERDFIFEEIGDFILEKGLSDGVKFLEKKEDFFLCLNVYRIQLESNYFFDNLMRYLNETGFPPKLLSLKFDSDCRFIGIERLRDIINKLKEQGIITIIGDFGSGTDSINFLNNEPVDAVSMEDFFAKDAIKNERTKNTLLHLSKIASGYVNHINLKGVDTKEIRDIVREFDITTMQGEYFSKPLSFEETVEKYFNGK